MTNSHPPASEVSSTRRGKLNLVLTNFTRNKKSVALSSIGLMVGIGALVFFIGLSQGIKEVVLGRIFLVDQVEVIPPKVSLGAQALGALFGGGAPENQAFTDDLITQLSTIDGVGGAYPKMKFTFPAFGFGGAGILGRDVRGELIADGIDPALVNGELSPNVIFADREAKTACQNDQNCDIGMKCVDQICEALACTPPRTRASSQAISCPTGSYCASDLKRCLRPIPILLNPQLLELYNGGLAIALGKGRSLPKISPELVQNFIFNAELNRSAIMRQRGQSLRRQLQVVGFNRKAISVGATLPISYVRRFNTRFTSREAGEYFHSVILKVKDQRRFPEIIAEVKRRGLELADQTSNAVQAAKIILSIEAIFTLIALGIVALASLNISQMFFMQITQRRREIGLLRALGASPTDIQKIILGEAALIGLLGGLLGILSGIGFSALIDLLAAHLPRFPYKPESFFVFPAWVYPAGIMISILFCIFGAFFPARAAARQDPAEALTR